MIIQPNTNKGTYYLYWEMSLNTWTQVPNTEGYSTLTKLLQAIQTGELVLDSGFEYAITFRPVNEGKLFA